RGRCRAWRVPRQDRPFNGGSRAQNRAVAAAWAPLRHRRPQGRTRASASGAGIGMISYALRCDRDHTFESWFQSSSAYESQVRRKLVSCPVCDSVKVEKAIMAPRIVGKKGRESAEPVIAPAPAETPAATETPAAGSTSLMMAQERELRAKIKELRDHIVKNADNVGEKFPNEARKMHYGEIEHRPIYGEASPEEAKSLIEEGVEVSPLPVLPEDRNGRAQRVIPGRSAGPDPESRDSGFDAYASPRNDGEIDGPRLFSILAALGRSLSHLRRADRDLRQGRRRSYQRRSRDPDPHRDRADHALDDPVRHRPVQPARRNLRQKLALPPALRTRHRRVLALLFPRAETRAGHAGGADRQIERGAGRPVRRRLSRRTADVERLARDRDDLRRRGADRDQGLKP